MYMKIRVKKAAMITISILAIGKMTLEGSLI